MNDQASGPNGNPKTEGSSYRLLKRFLRCLIPTARSLGTGEPWPNAPELFGRNLFEIWRILNKRKWLILSIVAACVALNAVRTLMQTPLYTATVRLQIDP